MTMKQNTATRLGVGIIASTLILSTGAAYADDVPITQADIDKAMSTPTTLTLWSWASFIKPEIAEFEQKYPAIKVDLVNVGQTQAEYTKISNAVLSGTGGPDLAMMDYLELPEFVLSGALQDLTPYGVAANKDDYTSSSWQSVTVGGQVVGVPQNTAPLVFFYRSDVFSDAGVAVPKTWADFLDAAATIKAKTGAAIINIDPGNADAILGMLRQIRAKPFTYDGKQTVGVDLSNGKVKQVADLLTKLIQSGEAATDPSLVDDWYQSFVRKKYVGWVAGASGQNNLINTLQAQTGLWRVAPLPQWSATDNVDGSTGGSATVILKASQHKIAAYELSQFLFHDEKIVAEGANRAFPTLKAVLNSDTFLAAPSPYFGNQLANKLYADVANTVNPDFEYLPFMSFVNATFNTTVGQAMTSKADLFPAFKDWEAQIKDYASQQGFTVK
jgi:multiple sugar transport system substrate-binding protein